jgi:hypothetical protein
MGIVLVASLAARAGDVLITTITSTFICTNSAANSPNTPCRFSLGVRKLQKALHAKAKAEAGYRFYALYD